MPSIDRVIDLSFLLPAFALPFRSEFTHEAFVALAGFLKPIA